ncbi:MAG: LysR family transcriptional regulator [Solobacterium sp.]|nr:LysR family transcriptional regulator [Solobacterium sp.]
MTLRHLEIFMCVCRHMSMTAAAEELNMSQPAVSKAIGELEAFYHASLFDRMNRKIYLTDAGHALADYASTILSQYEESISFLRDGSSFQDCRIAVNVTVGETILADLLKEIKKKVPQAQLKVGVYNSSTIETMLKRNECDLAVMDESGDPSFDVIELYEEPLGFFASAEYCQKESLRKTELSEYRLLLRENGSGTRTCTDSFLKQIRYPDSSIWESTSDEALTIMAERGLGIAVLPVSCVTGTKKLRRIEVEGAVLKRKFWLTALHSRYLNTAVQSCARVIHEYCRAHK